ncbi:MAG TPA: pyridoxal 5'-phosphate synthase glutaminase subunit PdxT [Nitriliruptorales bacterium]
MSPPGSRAWTPGERLVGRVASWDGDDRGPASDAPVVGVLALQGDVLEHLRALHRCGAQAIRVRTPADLARVHGLVVPGGESTTIGRLLERFGLMGPVRGRIVAGLPTFGTCAGMIVLSRELDQEFDQPRLATLGVRTRRNAFGRQVSSFDVSLDVKGIDGGPMDVAFIRAPWVTQVLDDDVDVWAEVDGHPVVVAQRAMLATSFHPEITGDDRLHAWFVEQVRAAA